MNHLSTRQVLGATLAIILTLLWMAGPLLVVQDKPHLADAIVVIGGDHKPERMRQAAELYRQGYAPLIIISAGTIVLEGDQPIPEAQVMYRQARELGLPNDRLILEQASKSTYENATYTKALCQARGIRSILLVTSAYHSRRARRLFQEVYASDITVSTQPAPPGQCALCWPFYSDQARVVAYEYWNWAQYGLNRIFP
jgi:uncharacterized SAM-binding protein YcdF (DUF218 family)